MASSKARLGSLNWASLDCGGCGRVDSIRGLGLVCVAGGSVADGSVTAGSAAAGNDESGSGERSLTRAIAGESISDVSGVRRALNASVGCAGAGSVARTESAWPDAVETRELSAGIAVSAIVIGAGAIGGAVAVTIAGEVAGNG